MACIKFTMSFLERPAFCRFEVTNLPRFGRRFMAKTPTHRHQTLKTRGSFGRCQVLFTTLPMSTPDALKSRFAWIVWMRGLACVLMFQTHCYDSWLGGQARPRRFSGRNSYLPCGPLSGGNLVRSSARRTSRRSRSSRPPPRIAEILGYGFRFRLEEYLIARG